jgi:hypothetical protein
MRLELKDTTMTIIRILLAALVISFFSLSTAAAQNFEITPHIAGQINGGVDLSTTLFRRLEVANALSYGLTAGYLMGGHYGIEFDWNRSHADTRGQPINGNLQSATLFSLNQNQYMGNFVLHLTDREASIRPFAFFGMGANALSTNHSGVSGSTRFAVNLGGGAKMNVSRHFGLRGQLKWTPTYLGTTNGGYWCDPFWGGCWVVGNSHYLHAFDIGGGVTLRF